ncbi:MAG: SRPBCC family protein [Nocardioides sp.]
MELQHRFTVPAGIEETWATFNDIEGVAGCFPGAVVTEADAESFKGTVKVKLGPIALVYNGTGTFVEKDETTHRLVIDAKGKDKRGNGTAGAMVTATMTEAAGGATDVEVRTDLTITGKAAQFGRGGVISDVSDKLLGQFVSCLEQQLTTEPATLPESPPEDPTSSAISAAASAPAAPPRHAAAPAAQSDDALDLGAAVLPVLLRAYWKPAVAVLAVITVVWYLVARD